MSRPKKLVLIVVSVLLAAVLFAPVHHCCGDNDEEQKRFEAVLGHAFSGDIAAIRQLYDESVVLGDKAGMHQWALLGAIEGDAVLTNIYLDEHNASPDEEKESDLLILKKNASRDGSSRLIRIIEKK